MAAINGTNGISTRLLTAPERSALLPRNESDIVGASHVNEPKPARVIFIGAGLSGIAFAYKANQIEKLSYTIYEKNADTGGVWLEHRYPGVSCDVPAHGYSYTWRANPDWSRFYASGEEICQWYQKLAREYGVYEHTKFNHKVVGAKWDDESQLWTVEVDNLAAGHRFTDTAEVLVNGGGPLDNWKWPDIEGLHDFQGPVLHTAKWDSSITLKGKRVAVIGSGASGIQLVPQLQPIVSKLVSFNRSPNWIAPQFAGQLAEHGRDTVYTADQKEEWRNHPEKLRDYRRVVEHTMNAHFPSFYKYSEAQKADRAAVAESMRKRLNNDSILCKKLIPNFELGCRRVTPGNGYLEAITKENAEVVTTGIRKVVPSGIISNDGQLHEVDVIVTATGYDTSFVPRFPIIGTGTVNLQDKWREEGAAAYLSVAVPGFPNYFTILGPNAPISNGSLVTAMEHLLDYALTFVQKIQKEGVTSAAVSDEAAAEFNEWKNEIMKGLSWSGSCTSWYKNGMVDGPVIGPWPGSVNHFLEIIKHPRYEDFIFKYKSRNRFTYFGDGRSTKEAKGLPLGWYIQ
ncbi:FAD/NAD(P)-binding domain-containing protein [Durotheca rogersii]|uniref:FAD/NAD(P)-binding domain-containing protein n=1 Tax=Durotheca rogersii TaxID=419775 RepID=UPI002220D7BF|nr:FAD/NAD(P)-binding domain-containing protein [Durotheca rogersii]KAI5857328.1 FAD/NAD(P)-binding domain-containing protein [Durotheca rogersii]